MAELTIRAKPADGAGPSTTEATAQKTGASSKPKHRRRRVPASFPEDAQPKDAKPKSIHEGKDDRPPPRAHWVSYVDEKSGRPYFYDCVSGATQWDDPAASPKEETDDDDDGTPWIDRLAAEFGVEDVPDLRAEEERLMAEARRFGELARNNPAMLARFRAARAVDAPTDDEAVAIIRSATAEAEEHQAAARAAIEQLVARGVNGMPLQEDNARIDRFVAEFGLEPPQI